MLMLPPTVKVYLSLRPLDLRKSFDGLSAATREVIRQDPTSGHLFVFLNRRRDRVKILAWDRNGFCLLYKRLEVGTFSLPSLDAATGSVEMEVSELAMMLDGVELKSVHRRPRWQPAHQAPKVIANNVNDAIVSQSCPSPSTSTAS